MSQVVMNSFDPEPSIGAAINQNFNTPAPTPAEPIHETSSNDSSTRFNHKLRLKRNYFIMGLSVVVVIIAGIMIFTGPQSTALVGVSLISAITGSWMRSIKF